jgi:hypothetical protein
MGVCLFLPFNLFPFSQGSIVFKKSAIVDSTLVANIGI